VSLFISWLWELPASGKGSPSCITCIHVHHLMRITVLLVVYDVDHIDPITMISLCSHCSLNQPRRERKRKAASKKIIQAKSSLGAVVPCMACCANNIAKYYHPTSSCCLVTLHSPSPGSFHCYTPLHSDVSERVLLHLKTPPFTRRWKAGTGLGYLCPSHQKVRAWHSASRRRWRRHGVWSRKCFT
jgi:hypothetical protein